MRFHKNVSIEKREYLEKELKNYERKTTLTTEERLELHKWVTAGNSVHSNPDNIYGEDGSPMDFIEAWYADIAMCEAMAAMSKEELAEFYRQQEKEALLPSFL
jgi:hypothetical protein